MRQALLRRSVGGVEYRHRCLIRRGRCPLRSHWPAAELGASCLPCAEGLAGEVESDLDGSSSARLGQWPGRRQRGGLSHAEKVAAFGRAHLLAMPVAVAAVGIATTMCRVHRLSAVLQTVLVLCVLRLDFD